MGLSLVSKVSSEFRWGWRSPSRLVGIAYTVRWRFHQLAGTFCANGPSKNFSDVRAHSDQNSVVGYKFELTRPVGGSVRYMIELD